MNLNKGAAPTELNLLFDDYLYKDFAPTVLFFYRRLRVLKIDFRKKYIELLRMTFQVPYDYRPLVNTILVRS